MVWFGFLVFFLGAFACCNQNIYQNLLLLPTSPPQAPPSPRASRCKTLVVTTDAAEPLLAVLPVERRLSLRKLKPGEPNIGGLGWCFSWFFQGFKGGNS